MAHYSGRQQPHHQHNQSYSGSQYGNQNQRHSEGRHNQGYYAQHGREKAQMAGAVGATFMPGVDDYMMPEPVDIVSPAPQRVMPEVPVQIADSLEHLELEASKTPKPRPGRMGSISQQQQYQQQQQQQQQQQRGYSDPYMTPPSSQGPGSRPISEDRHSSYHSSIADDYLSRFDDLNYSPFPKLVNPGPNIPPTDEEKEVQIEGARLDVLSSNDPEMQLIWAQDALNYVDVAMAHLTRLADPPGSRPQTPALEHQLKTDAVNVVSFLADQHHPRAEFMRGGWLEFGKFGHRIDKKEAFRCYARAAEKGFARAEYRMGMQFENSNEPMKAIKHYNNGAAMSDSASNYRLGMMTLLGQHGQRRDYVRGVDLIHQAADMADENAPQGAYVYGLLLARELPGIDVPESVLPVDLDLAREMIEKAAFLGFPKAQLKMGSAYELCQLGCEFNPALSIHYNALAARQGESEAEMAISKWFLCGHEGVFEKNEQLAFEYAQRAARSGLGTAEFAIGYFYEIGMYVSVDLKEAQRWYAKAAQHGNKDASSRIDGISRSKTLSRKDHENVAISKIRARHGSMRRKDNPVAQRHQRQPTENSIAEEPSMVPPGPRYNQQPGPPPTQRPAYPDGRGQQPPPLNTNFIRTDTGGSYGGPNQPPPGTALPYPSQPGVVPGLGPASPGPVRPNSAGGYGPLKPRYPLGAPPANRPYSIASAGPGAILPAGTYPANLPPRANSAMPGPGMGPPPGQFRRPSGQGPPGGRGQYAGPGPQNSGLQSPPPADIGFQAPEKHRPPPVDIGFEAPVARPPRSPGPRPPKSPAPTSSSGASSNNRPDAMFNHGLGGRPVGLPMSPKPLSPQSAQHPPAPQPQPQPQPPPSPKPQGPAPQPTPHPAAAAPKPPGKGPKTFEEMGVPAGKQDQDCVIM